MRKDPAWAKGLDKANQAVMKVEEVALFLLSLFLVMNMVIQVVCRYVLTLPTPWAEELSRFSFMWLAYIGCAYAIYRWEHIEINALDSILNRLKSAEKLKNVFHYITLILSILFLVIFCYLYGQFVSQVSQFGQRAPASGMNMIIPMVSALVGGALMLFHGVSRLILPPSMRAKPQTE